MNIILDILALASGIILISTNPLISISSLVGIGNILFSSYELLMDWRID